MDKLLEKFADRAKEINLSKAEKARMRGALFSYIKNHPVKRAEGVPFGFFAPAFRFAPVAALCLLLFGGVGATAAAEGTLPGDTLYPVKIYVNENARSLLSLSQKSKAEWEIKRADKRLKEIEKLASKGRLEPGLAAEAENRFKNHVDSAEGIASDLKGRNRGRDAAGIESSLKTVLLVHEDVLERMKSHDGEGEIEKEVADLHSEIKNKARDAAENLSESENDIRSSSAPDIKQAAEGKLNAAGNKLAEASKAVVEKKDKVSEGVLEEADKLLDEAGDTIAKGKKKLEDGSYGEAFVLFQKSIRLSQAAQQMVNISSLLPEIKDGDSWIMDFSEKIKFSEDDEHKDGNGNNSNEGNGDNNGEGHGNGENRGDESAD